jgi:hypothetical protein
MELGVFCQAEVRGPSWLFAIKTQKHTDWIGLIEANIGDDILADVKQTIELLTQPIE